MQLRGKRLTHFSFSSIFLRLLSVQKWGWGSEVRVSLIKPWMRQGKRLPVMYRSACYPRNLCEKHGRVNRPSSSGGDAFASDICQNVTEAIQLPERCIKIWRDADAGEFFVDNRCRKDVMFAEKIAADLSLIESFDLHVGNCAHLVRIEGSVEANLRHIFQFVHPIARKIAQPRFLAFAADAVMKQKRFTDGQLGRGRMRADLFELSDVALLFFFGGKQRPDFRDLVALDEKQASAFGAVEPFVK